MAAAGLWEHIGIHVGASNSCRMQLQFKHIAHTCLKEKEVHEKKSEPVRKKGTVETGEFGLQKKRKQ